MNLTRILSALSGLISGLLGIGLVSIQAIAGSNQGLTYTGRILKPDGTPVNEAYTSFTLNIKDATNNCLLWSEIQTVNMSGSQGTFSLVIGAGTRVDGGSHSLKQVFMNAGMLTGLNCATGTTYTPSATDDRNLLATFNDNGMAVTLAPVAIKAAPFALQAEQVSGYGIMNLAKISGSGSANAMTGLQFDFLTNLAAVASTSATPCAANDTLKFVGGVWTCAAAGGGGGASTSGLTAATSTNSIDNLNFAQTWSWSTASTQSPMSIAANALTTGSALNVTSSSASLNSTNGLLNVANMGASTNGMIARIQSNSTAGSGLTVLANGNVGIGTATPVAALDVVGQNASGSAPLGLKVTGGNSTTNGNGGGISITAGNGSSVGTGGAIQLTGGGHSVFAGTYGSALTLNGLADGGGASATLVGGNGRNGYGGGTVNIVGGAGHMNSNGGNVAIDGGAKAGTGSDGNVVLGSTRGNVGIGTATPGAKLEVNGAITSTVNPIAAGATVDLSKSNTHTLASLGGATTIALQNLADGGVYNIIVEDTAVATYSFSGCTNTYWKPAQGPTTAASRTVFGILAAKKAGPTYDCYVTWSSGFAP